LNFFRTYLKKVKFFHDTGKYHLGRIYSAGSELTRLSLFHMVHPNTGCAGVQSLRQESWQFNGKTQ
jgi:hypothetical protein